MVSRLNVSAYGGSSPQAAISGSKIGGGPIYDKADLLKLIECSNSIRLWTKKCIKDVQRHDLDVPAVAVLLRGAVTKGRFLGSEWCESKPGGPVAACDAYSFRKMEWNDAAKKDLLVEYYLKFAIAKTGTIVLVISCHV